MNAFSSKVTRYSNLVKKVKNWPAFLYFKITSRSSDSFIFRLRNSFSINVPRKMLGPFRECFFDEIYLKHINLEFLKKDKPTIIDIGANVGYFSLSMFSKYPGANIYAFEPMPYCFKVLQGYQSEYKSFNLNVYQNAVSDKDGTIDIYTDSVDNFSTTSSLLFRGKRTHKLSIETKTLDSFLTSNNIDTVDLLKLDCEGSEFAILYNLPERWWPSISTLSIETHNTNKESENLMALVDFLKSKKYDIVFDGESTAETCGYIWASRI
jgi:FkbM family methyltransferase